MNGAPREKVPRQTPMQLVHVGNCAVVQKFENGGGDKGESFAFVVAPFLPYHFSPCGSRYQAYSTPARSALGQPSRLAPMAPETIRFEFPTRINPATPTAFVPEKLAIWADTA